MRILFIGDIFGRPGRTIVKDRLPGIVRDHAVDLIIANGENGHDCQQRVGTDYRTIRIQNDDGVSAIV